MTSFLQKNKFLLSFFIFCPQFVPKFTTIILYNSCFKIIFLFYCFIKLYYHFIFCQ
nr:MAG TPA: hypothetical protein [Caudoviricetes sp.]DAP99702.1 MAG TPA: hypothetical protein [Caudoviricetes sp.]